MEVSGERSWKGKGEMEGKGRRDGGMEGKVEGWGAERKGGDEEEKGQVVMETF